MDESKSSHNAGTKSIRPARFSSLCGGREGKEVGRDAVSQWKKEEREVRQGGRARGGGGVHALGVRGGVLGEETYKRESEREREREREKRATKT
jgi:hypothetical protein